MVSFSIAEVDAIVARANLTKSGSRQLIRLNRCYCGICFRDILGTFIRYRSSATWAVREGSQVL